MLELWGNERMFLNKIAGYDCSTTVVARHRLDVREGSQGTSTLQYTPSTLPLQGIFPSPFLSAPSRTSVTRSRRTALGRDHLTTAGAEVSMVVPLVTVSVLSLRLKMQGFSVIPSPSCGPAPGS